VEHWGAITALESQLLFDAAASAPARAIAHQWLAISATMASGDDCWLNEARLLPQIAASIRVREKRD
jgi:aminopeptidase N